MGFIAHVLGTEEAAAFTADLLAILIAGGPLLQLSEPTSDTHVAPQRRNHCLCFFPPITPCGSSADCFCRL